MTQGWLLLAGLALRPAQSVHRGAIRCAPGAIQHLLVLGSRLGGRGHRLTHGEGHPADAGLSLHELDVRRGLADRRGWIIADSTPHHCANHAAGRSCRCCSLGTMASLQSFEVEQVLGTAIPLFRLQHDDLQPGAVSHPSYAPAAALAVLVSLVRCPWSYWPVGITGGRQYTTVTGQFKNRPYRSVDWRYPLLACVAAGDAGGARGAGGPDGRRHVHDCFGFLNIAASLDAGQLGDCVFSDPRFCARSPIRSSSHWARRSAGHRVLYALIAYIAVRSRFACGA